MLGVACEGSVADLNTLPRVCAVIYGNTLQPSIFQGQARIYAARLFNMACCQLNSDDLTEVRRALWEARSKWYDIGLELKLKADDLEVIKQTCSDSVEKCLTEMILKWLRTIEPHPPSWTTLCDALRKPAVDRCDIAKSIQKLSSRTASDSMPRASGNTSPFLAPPHSNTRKGFYCQCGKCNWDDYLQNRNRCPTCDYPGLDIRCLK